MSEPQKPSLGRIVHFTNEDGHARAAIVTDVQSDPDRISVELFGNKNTCGKFFYHVQYDESGKTPFTWRWPPRA